MLIPQIFAHAKVINDYRSGLKVTNMIGRLLITQHTLPTEMLTNQIINYQIPIINENWFAFIIVHRQLVIDYWLLDIN
jgi:hypothetical protein